MFLPLVKGTAIICCTCTLKKGIYSTYEALTSAQLKNWLGLCSEYFRTFPRKLKINILQNFHFEIHLVLSWHLVMPVAKHTVDIINQSTACWNFTKFYARVHYLFLYFIWDSTLYLVALSSFSCMRQVLINCLFIFNLSQIFSNFPCYDFWDTPSFKVDT